MLIPRYAMYNIYLRQQIVLRYIIGITIREKAADYRGQCIASVKIDEQLSIFIHKGFWHPMDTLRDKRYLESLWEKTAAPWKIW